MVFNFKTTVFLVLFLSVFENSEAQALQFVQVITFSGDIQVMSTAISNGPIYSCPAGKIWKIESLNIYQMGGGAGVKSYMTYKINSSPLGVDAWADPFTVNAIFPIWLKEGDTIQPSFNPVGEPAYFGGYPQSYFISILEFTAP